MVSPLVSRAPQCISCIRRLSGSVGGSFNVHAGQQVRGKKKLAKVSTIRVQLLQNVPGYGRRGAVIPVTAGVMRNIWFPKGMAQYVTASNLQALGVKKDAPLERDSTFRSTTEKKLERQVEEEEPEQVVDEAQEEEFRPAPIVPAPSIIQAEPRAPQIELDLMSPDRATSILEDLLPPNLDFYRTTITVPTKKISPSISSSSAIAAAAQAAKADSNKIHGSVSTSDIAANLKAILAEDEQGARVVVSPEQISFVQKTDEKDRVKQLGVFEIQIRLEGASDSVRRTVQVHAQS
jgi:ribosomal protein L9